MNRSAKDGARSSPHYGDEGATHSPIVPRCLLTARYGRFMCDPRRPASVSAQSRARDPISKSEVGSDAAAGVGERHMYLKRETNNSCDRNGGPRVVRGRTFVNGSSKDKARLMRKEREDGKFLL